MSFSQMFTILKEQHREEIVLIKLGIFYIATGSDAVLLHDELGLKCICYKNNECKIGIPVKNLDKYLIELEKIKYSYVVYDMNKEKVELKKIKEYRGKKINSITNKNINCLLCKGLGAYKEDDVYLEALRRKYEKEMKE